MTVPVLSETIGRLVGAGSGAAGSRHHLPATAETCYWGFIDAGRKPVLTIDDGDVVQIETITHRAGDAPDLLMDEGVRALWEGIPGRERGPGPHILTGPIRVRGARPGSTLVVQISELEPRLSHGANLAARNGLLYDTIGKERSTIYELRRAGGRDFAVPLFGLDLGPEIYEVPGYVTAIPEDARQPFGMDVAVPVRPHFGILGVAPDTTERLSTAPPGRFGGNVDDWRFGVGATICYPIYSEGALFYAGDPHFGQGDGEISGTAIEASLSGTIRLSVADDISVGSPLLETGSAWVTHGFGDTLDEAMAMAADQTMWMLTDRFGLVTDDAYSLCSVAVDFGVTQVVDGVVGCHGIVPKAIFA